MELNEIARKFYLRYAQNFSYYISIVGKKKYREECEKIGAQPLHSAIKNFLDGKTSFISPNHSIVLSYITKLPIGVLLCSDILYLNQNLIISITPEKAEIEINSAWISDGVFFYSKQFDKFITVGSPNIQEYVTQQYDTRKYKLC